MIDLRRLARAVHLDAAPRDHETWHVMGRASLHVVTGGDDGLVCDCEDFRVRGGLCKHALRILLARGDRAVIEQLRTLIPDPGRYPRKRRSEIDRRATTGGAGRVEGAAPEPRKAR